MDLESDILAMKQTSEMVLHGSLVRESVNYHMPSMVTVC